MEPFLVVLDLIVVARGAEGLSLLFLHASLVDLLAELANLHLSVKLAIYEAELLLTLIDHHVEFEAAHAGHVLSHSFLMVDTLGNLVQLLLKPKVLLQVSALFGLVIRVQDAIELPFDIVQIFILLVLQALLSFAVNYFQLFKHAKLIEVFFRLLFAINDQVSLFLEGLHILRVEELVAALDQRDAVNVDFGLLRVYSFHFLRIAV